MSVQSELIANEQVPPASGDPRAAVALDHPLIAEYQAGDGHAVVLVHQTQPAGCVWRGDGSPDRRARLAS